jgi:transcriptional regulator with XRE-family HTH domain
MSRPKTGFASVSGALRVPLPIDDEWRTAVRQAIRALGETQYTLADHINCSQSNVSQALSSKIRQPSSQFAHAISMAVGVELPLEGRAYLVAHVARGKNPEALKSILEGLESTYGIPGVRPPPGKK